MFKKVLVANRNEIALRVIRACREIGVPTVAVYSTADANAVHVRFADEAICIGPPSATLSYLNQDAILAAAEITGADAVHPGYGFLAENAQFAGAVTRFGLTFIGPDVEHLRMFGDKLSAKAAAAKAEPAKVATAAPAYDPTRVAPAPPPVAGPASSPSSPWAWRSLPARPTPWCSRWAATWASGTP